LLYCEAVREQVILDGNGRYRFAGEGVRAYAKDFGTNWKSGGWFHAYRSAKRMMDSGLEVPIEIRELAVIGIGNGEKLLALFFDNVANRLHQTPLINRADQAGDRG
jgi:hypothetical protein